MLREILSGAAGAVVAAAVIGIGANAFGSIDNGWLVEAIGGVRASKVATKDELRELRAAVQDAATKAELAALRSDVPSLVPASTIARELRADGEFLAALGALPLGTVVASIDECASESGWVPYYPAAGRFIVGAGQHSESGLDNDRNHDRLGATLTVYDGPDGLQDQTLRRHEGANSGGKNRIGGAETHRLTVEEMPAHSHSFTGTETSLGGRRSERKLDTPAVGDVRDLKASYLPKGVVGLSGGDAAHNNMPPYIALYLCKKEAG
ncbi:MAG: hypothetical protein AAGF50_00175 [Pseudomonadota bacterium]